MTSPSDACRRVLDARIARALVLADARPACAEVLTFYADLAGRQRDLLSHAARLLTASGGGPAVASAPDMGAVADLVPAFVDAVRASAPRRVDETLAPLARLTAGDWQRLCAEMWRHPGAVVSAPPAAEAFVAEAVLQPFAEFRAAGAAGEAVAGADATRCPRCGGRALSAILRERGHGAGRALVCGFCAAEWTVPRVVCPACGETRVEVLPVFRDGDLPAVRLDACDTCRAYVKAVDLTVDGRLDPVVDDLATPALDLWATAQGYRRLRPNLLRV